MNRIETCALRHGYDFGLALEVAAAYFEGFQVLTEDKGPCKSSRLVDLRQAPPPN